ncbi:hypothetical protein [Halosimplex salinum]|uniref:hypothetical protein n=1 Tax=Halosimplex salinum TaxID=1710538 RepID=UPI000F4721BD|nr:hypothetical protein [Halosimplex salinum]
MKQGSADDPFAEEPAESGDDGDDDSTVVESVDPDPDPDTGTGAVLESEPTAEPTDGHESPSSSSGIGSERRDTGSTGTSSLDDRRSSGGESTQRQSLPYIHARDGVKDGRTQRPVFLRDHVETGIDDLVAEMEAELGEDVYKTDVTEAAMAVAQENPGLVLAKLEEWGYGWT